MSRLGNPGEPRRPRGARALLVVLLLAAIYAGYARALDGELQFDDLRLLNENRPVKDLPHYLGSRFADEVRIGGRALTYLTFAVNYHWSALAVRPYHLVNLALHLATVVAVLGLGLTLLRRSGWRAPFTTALAAAALFGLHPMQSQAVSYVFQRAELLGSLFYVFALWLALAAQASGRTGRGAVAALGALACFFLGWCAKPMVATLPVALLLCAGAFPSPDDHRPLRARAGPLLAFSLPFFAVTAVFSRLLLGGLRGSGEAGFSIPTMSVQQYLLTQPRVILTYLRLLAWPSGQNLDWAFPPSASLLEPRTALSWALVIALLLAAAWLLLRSARPDGDAEARPAARLASVGVLWFFILLAPTSSVVPLADVIEEHRVYLASWGLFLGVAAAGVHLVRRFAPGRRGAMAGSAMALAVCAALLVALHRRNAIWETAVSLWTDVVKKSPGKARGHMNLGFALIQSDPERALAETRAAGRLAGDGSVNSLELAQNLAGILLRLGRHAEAIGVLQQIAARSESPEVLTNLAIAYLETGQLGQARTLASRVAARWPDYGPAFHTLGQLDSLQHDYHSALAHFRRAVELDPDAASSLSSLAVTQQMLGDRAGACASWARYPRSGAPGADADASRMMTALGCPAR